MAAPLEQLPAAVVAIDFHFDQAQAVPTLRLADRLVELALGGDARAPGIAFVGREGIDQRCVVPVLDEIGRASCRERVFRAV